jgi:hypothetical protein
MYDRWDWIEWDIHTSRPQFLTQQNSRFISTEPVPSFNENIKTLDWSSTTSGITSTAEIPPLQTSMIQSFVRPMDQMNNIVR